MRVSLVFFVFLLFCSALQVQSHSAYAASSAVLSSLPTQQKTVALTFDDGPAANEGKILSILTAEHVQATFFWIGNQANAKQAQRILEQGSSIENHSYNHAFFKNYTYDQIYSNLQKSQNSIQTASNTTPVYFRPPYGYINSSLTSAAQDLGLTMVTWNVDSRDWANPGRPDVVKQLVYSEVQPGSIILFHEKDVTVSVLAEIIEHLKANGYSFSLLPGLMSTTPPKVSIVANGQTLQEKGILQQGTTLAPLRPVLETLGVKVIWNSDGQIDLVKGNEQIQLTLGSQSLVITLLDDPSYQQILTLSQAPYLENSTTIAPLRPIAEALGFQVNWLGDHVELN